MRFIVLVALCVLVTGCKNAEPATPKEQEEQEQRMRVFLDESSPRKMNHLPKVTPELKKSFNTKGSTAKKQAPTPAELEEQKKANDNW